MGLLAPALVETLLVTFRGIFQKTAVKNPVPHLPLPSEYLDVVIVYGALGFIPGRASRVATLVGWGFVVATALSMTSALTKLSTKDSTPQTTTKTAGTS